jgi:hypothetical protein
MRRTSSAESAMNSATFSAADPATTNTFQPPADAVTSFTMPELRSRACRPHDQFISACTLRRNRRET